MDKSGSCLHVFVVDFKKLPDREFNLNSKRLYCLIRLYKSAVANGNGLRLGRLGYAMNPSMGRSRRHDCSGWGSCRAQHSILHQFAPLAADFAHSAFSDSNQRSPENLRYDLRIEVQFEVDAVLYGAIANPGTGPDEQSLHMLVIASLPGGIEPYQGPG